MPMKSSPFAFLSALLFTCVVSGKGVAIWFPMQAGPGAQEVPVVSIVQVGSEVHVVAIGPGIVHDYDVDLSTSEVAIEFPSLFIASCFYSLELHAHVQEDFYAIYDRRLGTYGKYNYDHGSGWIFHRKAGVLNSRENRFLESLGWMYIREYPWVFFLKGGWRFVVETEATERANAWWFYEFDLGWFWTTRDLYPEWIYLHGHGWQSYEG